jgi:hypothetical protein
VIPGVCFFLLFLILRFKLLCLGNFTGKITGSSSRLPGYSSFAYASVLPIQDELISLRVSAKYESLGKDSGSVYHFIS